MKKKTKAKIAKPLYRQVALKRKKPLQRKAPRRDKRTIEDTSVVREEPAAAVAQPTGISRRKHLGQYFTPPEVAKSLVRWVVENPRDRLLDPSCGSGHFLVWHPHSVGVEVDPENAALARTSAPGRLVHGGDFFQWSAATRERFDAIVGNPPFIRYQNFTGQVRGLALASASLLGAKFSALTSSWAPFVLVASGLLRRGGRMAFVVPAELGHANYAQALVPALCGLFSTVHVIACREKLFPELSEDCWILHCRGFGERTDRIRFSIVDRFTPTDEPPEIDREVTLGAWRNFGCRLRPFLLSQSALSLYSELVASSAVKRLGDCAAANIGYVSGANDFFHLRPSDVRRLDIPSNVLRVAIRKSEQLPEHNVTSRDVARWIADDEPVMLLNLTRDSRVSSSVQRYLESDAARQAQATYKCRNRKPWYAVPDVKTPAAFLSVMSSERPTFVLNEANCVCTNSIHTVVPRNGMGVKELQRAWDSPLAQLGAEIEGHPLGGGMLKIEPREAARVPLPLGKLHLTQRDQEILDGAIRQSRRWRHYA